LLLVPSLHAQRDTNAYTWLREAPRRAEKLAGCYRLATPIEDSIAVPAAFRLSPRPVGALGYHRVAAFWTDLPRVDRAETRPIWTPLTDDSIDIELEPASMGFGTQYHIVVRIDGDSLSGVFQDRSWVRDTTAARQSRLV